MKQKPKNLPNKPGVYLIKDAHGEIVYVGKATSLRERIGSYFRPTGSTGTRIEKLLSGTTDIEYQTTDSEVAALNLECELIKKYHPKYNVQLRDDKKYPFVRVTVQEEYPAISVTRKLKSDGSKYYGPYTSAKELRETLKIMRRFFPLRSCRYTPNRTRPCLNYDLKQCLSPCTARIKKRKYQGLVNEACLFLEGAGEKLIRQLEKKMEKASLSLKFEEAIALRDKIKSLKRIVEKEKSMPIPEIMKIDCSMRGKRGKEEGLFLLGNALGLPSPPQRIEAFDISNIIGKEAVGVVVVFEQGEPMKKDYRRFKIKLSSRIDDYGMMREVIMRRYERLKQEGRRYPELILIDGGRGHLNSTVKALEELGLEKIPVVAIAKRLEEVFIPNKEEPLIIPENALYLIERIRDEAHRFALTFHRRLRTKKMLSSDYTHFQRRVWEIVSTIPSGETQTYRWVAEKLGNPKSVRAVGQALKKNPLPGIIPCHRVIRSDGSLGGFSRGEDKKRQLLLSEIKKAKKLPNS
jgi:excinuclease ABC subunit C